jgi:uncharacterized membrane protein
MNEKQAGPPAEQATRSTLEENQVRKMELLISKLLRGGVAVSLLLVMAGSLLSYLHHPEYLSSKTELQRLTRPGEAVPQTWQEVISGVMEGRGQCVVAAGILLLIATPVMRVGVSIFAFYFQGDRLYTGITLLVFCLLLLSFALGRIE